MEKLKKSLVSGYAGIINVCDLIIIVLGDIKQRFENRRYFKEKSDQRIYTNAQWYENDDEYFICGCYGNKLRHFQDICEVACV